MFSTKVDKSVTINGDNSGIVITGDNNTITLPKENLLSKKCVTDTFTTYYQNHFKTISLLIEDDKKPIDDIYVNLAIIREEKEEDIKDKSKLLDRDKIINSYEEIYKPKEPIAIEELIEKSSKNNSAKALIYGKAGIGKTTFCKYIAYRWSKGKLYREFENIVYIALREWKDNGLESIIKKIYFKERYKDEAIEIYQSKTLFLFDGYDELLDTSLLHGAIKKYNLQNYIITSRPYGYRKSDFDVNEVFETIGFTDENVIAYIDKFFEEKSHRTNLENFLKQNINIKHIAYIPLMLEMICSLWREEAKSNQPFLSPMTMTELYSKVVDNMFSKYYWSENRKDESVHEWENREDIKHFLGKIAFEGLKKQRIQFDGEFITKIIKKEEMAFLKNSVINSGFLKTENKDKSILGNKEIEFPHLTFQEYFSALYVSKLPPDKISEVIREYKFYPYMQVFFAFLGGLIEDKKFLLTEIESEPIDVLGLHQFLLILYIISEMNIEIILSKMDFIKKGFFWLEYLLKNTLDYKFILNLLKVILYKVTEYNDDIDKIIDDLLSRYDLNDYGINSGSYFGDLVKFVKELIFYSNTKKYLLNSLSYSEFDINKFIKINEKFHPLIKESKTHFLLKRYIIDYQIIDELLKIIENENIDYDIRKEIINFLFNENLVKDFLLLNLILVMENENIHSHIREIIAISLGRLNTFDDLFINILIKIILNENIHPCVREAIAENLLKLSGISDSYLNEFLLIIKNENIHARVTVALANSIAKLKVLNNTFVFILLSIIENENIDANVRVAITSFLDQIKYADNHLIYKLLDIASNNSIDDNVRSFIISHIPMHKQNINIGNKLIFIINSEKNHYLIRYHTIETIIKLKYINQQNIDKLIDILEKRGTNFHIKYKILRMLSKLRLNSIQLGRIFKITDNKNDYFLRVVALEVLLKHQIINKDIIYDLINILEDKDKDFDIRVELIQLLINIRTFKEIIIHKLIFLINENISNSSHEWYGRDLFKSLDILISQDYNILTQINIKKFYSKNFISYISTKTFFYALNNNYIDLEILIENVIHHHLPIYIKNKKLCTIYENKEIQTQREVTLEEIERVKNELGLDCINY